ncbi:uncharacterized protein RJT21DRAFT_118320 [Scheffersomyces amazonensis]|uniref:uncharacterized protein n=1 Tax=Scheffersomyces amazonensis TaxID=1078765 RepID=UPI00315CBD29
MSALDKSLDDIISSSKSTRRVGRKFGKGVAKQSNKVGKKVGGPNSKAKKSAVAIFKKPEPAVAAALSAAIDTSYATKVVASNLPKDLKQENVKDFFQSQVGGVISVALTYNEKGQFRGIATIIFRNHKLASKAVEKYNGAAIDNGSSKLKLELIVDPSKKPLTSRITPNKVAATAGAGKKKLAVAKKAAVAVKAKANTKKAQPKKKQQKPKKKTVEELDQEMAEYFA